MFFSLLFYVIAYYLTKLQEDAKLVHAMGKSVQYQREVVSCLFI
jgi:hypothetical protein